MLRYLLVLIGFALASSTSYAASVVNVQNTFCSGALSSSVNSPLSFSCAGNLTLSGGILSDGAGITLSSTGTLTLDNIAINAPQILLSGTSILMGQGVSLAGSNILLNASVGGVSPLYATPVAATISINGFSAFLPLASGSLSSLASGGNVNIASAGIISIMPVPEPSTYITMLIGLLLLIGFQRMFRNNAHFVA